MARKKTDTLEAPFQQVLEDYVTAVIAKKKAEYKGGLESFDAYAKKLRQQLENDFIAFHTRLEKGAIVIFSQLKNEKKRR
ncbi:MAG TPA: hypothetical protein VN457_05790 [Chlamydiales bacterium]|nr:hypothetical protein [Chlamydiales bacterium]